MSSAHDDDLFGEPFKIVAMEDDGPQPNPAPVPDVNPIDQLTDTDERDPLVWGHLQRFADKWTKDGEKIEGRPRKSLVNTMVILRHHPGLSGYFRENAFSRRQFCWNHEMKDHHDVRLVEWMAHVYGLDTTTKFVNDAVMRLCSENAFHPVREWLDRLAWDGTKRAERLWADYFGAADTELYRSYSRRFLVGAVARIFDPGCKVDTMPVLYGDQGLGKSQGLKALVGEWFSDGDLDLRDKDAALCMQGIWVYELAELDALRKKDWTTIKGFLSRPVDRFRAPYARRVDDYARQTIFAGTTNNEMFLGDPTGSRRFWPVHVGTDGDVRLKRLREDRDQIWAEAVHLYRSGLEWWLTKDEDGARDHDSESYSLEDPWDVAIDQWLAQNPQKRTGTTLKEILAGALDVPTSMQHKGQVMRLADLLRARGWNKTKSRHLLNNNALTWVWSEK